VLLNPLPVSDNCQLNARRHCNRPVRLRVEPGYFQTQNIRIHLEGVEETRPLSTHDQVEDGEPDTLFFEELRPLPTSWIINGEGEGETETEPLCQIEAPVSFTTQDGSTPILTDHDGLDPPVLEERLPPKVPERPCHSPECDIPLYATLAGTTSAHEPAPYDTSDSPEPDTASALRTLCLNGWLICSSQSPCFVRF